MSLDNTDSYHTIVTRTDSIRIFDDILNNGSTNKNINFYQNNNMNQSDGPAYDDYDNNDNTSQDMSGSEQPLYTQVIIVTMYVLIIIVAVGGNLLFSYVIVMRPKMRSVTNLFLLNLAVADIVKAIICTPFTFMANLILMYWPYGDLMCPVVTYLQAATVFLSSFTLVAMCIDRYIAIRFPMRTKMSKRAFAIIMVLIWALSFATPLPTAITSRVVYQDDPNMGLCLEEFEDDQERYVYSVAIMILQYFLPLLVITFTNTHIGYIVWIKKTPGEAEQDRDKRMAASKRRLVKMIIILVVIYAVCWLPLHVITLIGDADPTIYNYKYMSVVWTCFHWLAMSHTCYNPVVYFSLNTSFRRSLKRVVFMCRHKHIRLRQTMSFRGTGFWDNGFDIYGSDETIKAHASRINSIRSKDSVSSNVPNYVRGRSQEIARFDAVSHWKVENVSKINNDTYC